MHKLIITLDYAKKLAGTLFFLVAISSVSLGQIKFLGTSLSGGPNDMGSVYTVDDQGNETLIKAFDRKAQEPFANGFTYAPDGTTLLGTTLQGGKFNGGTIFSYDPSGGGVQVINSMSYTNGGHSPYGQLMKASDGYYYGYSTNGGIFRFDANNDTTIQLHNSYGFGSNNGRRPWGTPVEIAPGLLMGTTSEGGINNFGVIFTYDINTSTSNVLFEFDSASGGRSVSGLCLTSTGDIYGMTNQLGTNGNGTIFKYDLGTNSFSKILDMGGGAIYGTMYGSFVEADNGDLLGVTYYGGSSNRGTVFKIDTTADTVGVVASLSNSLGGYPRNSLAKAAGNKFYGTTAGAGANNAGTLFEFDYTTKTITNLHDFGGAGDGKTPSNNVFYDGNTNKIIGLTQTGGVNNMGVLFEYDLGTSTYTKKHDLIGAPEGAIPSNAIYQSSGGTIYGATLSGGKYDFGVLYKIDPLSLTYTFVADFTYNSADKNGGNCYGGFVEGADGKIYGVCRNGGDFSRGTLWYYDPVADTLMKVHDFTYTVGGYYPRGRMTWNADSSLLYGMTTDGGANSEGTIYTFDPVTKAVNHIYDFDPTPDGKGGEEGLLLASDGKFYGHSRGGGANGHGIIFSYDPNTSTFTKEHDYNNALDGGYGENTFIEGKNGNLYTTLAGGGQAGGSLVRYNYLTKTFTNLYATPSTGGTDGKLMYGDLKLSPDSNYIFGVFAERISAAGMGQLYRYDIQADTMEGVHDFDGSIVGATRTDLVILECDKPVVSAQSSDTMVCEGSNVNLNVTQSGASNSEWYLNGAATGTSGNMLTLSNTTLSDSGSYILKLNNICGNTEPEIVVSVEPSPVVEAGSDTALCDGDSITLSATGTAVSYAWDNGVSDGISFSPDSTMTYTVTGQNSIGCESTDMITVQVGLMPEIKDNNGTLTTGVYTTYQWYKDGSIINGATSQEYTPTESGSYTVEVSNGNCTETSEALAFSMAGIKLEDNISVNIYPNPSSGVVYVEWSTSVVSQGLMAVFDATGKELMHFEMTSNRTEIALPSGYYSLVLTHENGVVRKKLIVQ